MSDRERERLMERCHGGVRERKKLKEMSERERERERLIKGCHGDVRERGRG